MDFFDCQASETLILDDRFEVKVVSIEGPWVSLRIRDLNNPDSEVLKQVKVAEEVDLSLASFDRRSGF